MTFKLNVIADPITDRLSLLKHFAMSKHLFHFIFVKDNIPTSFALNQDEALAMIRMCNVSNSIDLCVRVMDIENIFN